MPTLFRETAAVLRRESLGLFSEKILHTQNGVPLKVNPDSSVAYFPESK
jgi:hypothetical protein